MMMMKMMITDGLSYKKISTSLLLSTSVSMPAVIENVFVYVPVLP